MKNAETGERTALYRFFDEDDVLLYVGITDSTGRRWEQHMRVKPWWPEARRQTVRWYDSRKAAEEAERTAIENERPVYNIASAAPPLAEVVAEHAWRCPICGWEAFALTGQIDHMLHELPKLAEHGDTSRLNADLVRSREALERGVKVLARSQASFAHLTQTTRRQRRAKDPGQPLAEAEAQMLLDDLRRVAGAERIRLAELPSRLRSRRPDSALYEKMTGVQLRAILAECGIRTTNKGNVLRLDPADLPRASEITAPN